MKTKKFMLNRAARKCNKSTQRHENIKNRNALDMYVHAKHVSAKIAHTMLFLHWDAMCLGLAYR